MKNSGLYRRILQCNLSTTAQKQIVCSCMTSIYVNLRTKEIQFGIFKIKQNKTKTLTRSLTPLGLNHHNPGSTLGRVDVAPLWQSRITDK